ncbi:polyhydroxybutyrate depolymerase [Panacagrimonas perspica]|uniref:Polyhydroxybutyrate depolymerase n=1 Tax=Panacagrimonas perspica TaxID=381431 RepID=A0A4R7NWP8_9GAMM|nr:PHB depolymerase family esterase [Panacagrimonas perspica]TDU25653.1 polyhydroxybutyrate depolymerase [Panacagrimonas perspica]THD03755.1 hypothetical protein B1810_07685 [Panacagrimonas perspica]
MRTPAGTRSYEATLTVNGQARRYVVTRPDPKPLNAPVLLLLHPRDTAPELTANFTYVSDFVATQNFWAVMPEALGGVWKAEPLDGTADKDFMAALIDAIVAEGADAERVSVAGYSSGGVMAERMACEMSDRIAAVGVVAATLPLSLWLSCAPAQSRPKVYVLGTADPIAPYYGISGLGSAASLMDYWAQKQGCGGATSTALPDIADDGTTVQLDERTGCTDDKGLRLYSVANGGHAWPGGDTSYAGVTSRDMSATGAIWSFARGYHR